MNTEQQRTFEQLKQYVLGADDIIPYIETINIPEARELLYVKDEESGEQYIAYLFFTGFFSLREIKFLLKSNKKLFSDWKTVSKRYEEYLNLQQYGRKTK